MNVPYGSSLFESPEEQMRRRRQAALTFSGDGVPQASRDQSLRIDPRRYDEAMAFGDATDQIDQSIAAPRPQPKGFLGHVLNAAPTIAASLDENLTGDGAGDRFFSGLGRGYLRQYHQGLSQQRAQQEAEKDAQELKGKLLDRTLRQRQIDAGNRPEWQTQGYPSFEEWRGDQSIRRSGQALAPRVIGTDPEGNVTVMIGEEVRRFDRAGKPIDMRPSVLPGVTVNNAPVGNYRGPGGIGSETRVIDLPTGAARTPSAGQQDDAAGYDASLADLASARTQVAANPKAFGLGKQALGNLPGVGGIARRLITRKEAETDPGFVRARASVGVLNSTIRKLQSGAAVTPYEGQVLESFTGDEWRDDADAILLKFQQVEEWIRNKKAASRQQRVVGAPSGGDDDPENPY